MVVVLIAAVAFSANDDGPTDWEGAVVRCELIGFEEQTRKDGCDGDGLPVGQVNGLGAH
jgi:hypothetical protein